MLFSLKILLNRGRSRWIWERTSGAEAKNFSRFPEELGTMVTINPKWLNLSSWALADAPTLLMNILHAFCAEGSKSPFVSQIEFI